jgi:hypothetical protein
VAAAGELAWPATPKELRRALGQAARFMARGDRPADAADRWRMGLVARALFGRPEHGGRMGLGTAARPGRGNTLEEGAELELAQEGPNAVPVPGGHHAQGILVSQLVEGRAHARDELKAPGSGFAPQPVEQVNERSSQLIEAHPISQGKGGVGRHLRCHDQAANCGKGIASGEEPRNRSKEMGDPSDERIIGVGQCAVDVEKNSSDACGVEAGRHCILAGKGTAWRRALTAPSEGARIQRVWSELRSRSE